ncbi:MAG TPA: hypothetical protein VJR71_13250 [Pseudolabrys sp.]|nr:hypothetical protein [Pseudolabrys sp.]
MTDISYQASLPGMTTEGSSYVAHFTAWWGQFAQGAREGREIAARYHALSRLSTHDLARRGLTRQAIARAALTGH